jgi:hypothetical protein
MKLKFFFCQFPNPWALSVSGMGGYTSKCEKSQNHCTLLYIFFSVCIPQVILAIMVILILRVISVITIVRLSPNRMGPLGKPAATVNDTCSQDVMKEMLVTVSVTFLPT